MKTGFLCFLSWALFSWAFLLFLCVWGKNSNTAERFLFFSGLLGADHKRWRWSWLSRHISVRKALFSLRECTSECSWSHLEHLNRSLDKPEWVTRGCGRDVHARTHTHAWESQTWELAFTGLQRIHCSSFWPLSGCFCRTDVLYSTFFHELWHHSSLAERRNIHRCVCSWLCS